MIIKRYRSVVTSLKSPGGGTYTLEFQSLKGGYKFAPGQFLHLALDSDYDGTGQWPESRCFSMQSNPDETNIRITYAVKGRFTTMMETHLRVGSEVWLKLPYGDLFTRDHIKVNTVFIAGGTGITPFLSLFTHESFSAYSNPRIYLGFRSSEHNIYKAELNRLCNRHHYLRFWYQDVDGPINIQQIYKENGPNPDYFISGPPEMIKTFTSYLIENGIPDSQVKTDDWE